VNTGFWWGKLRERDNLGDRDVGGRIILKCIFRKWNLGFMEWIELVSGTYECFNEPSGSINVGEFVTI